MRVVFDSNVYISALVLPGGVAERAMRAAMEGTFELTMSRPILAEVLGVLSRKFAREPEELARTALFLSSLAGIVAPVQRVQVLADGPDNRILECALAANADLIVTGDQQMLSLGAWEGIEILSLRQFVDRLGQPREVRQSRGRYQVSKSPKSRAKPFGGFFAAVERMRAEGNDPARDPSFKEPRMGPPRSIELRPGMRGSVSLASKTAKRSTRVVGW